MEHLEVENEMVDEDLQINSNVTRRKKISNGTASVQFREVIGNPIE